MNGNTNDTNYRYTMPIFNVTIGGKGNGVFTVFNNIIDVCKSMNHPVDTVMSYIAAITGSNYIAARHTLTGTHKVEDLTQLILEYIRHLVMCPKCNIPETIPKLVGNKKNTTINLCCSACRNESQVKVPNKRIDKGVDIIIKYLKAENIWPTAKGTMVKQTVEETSVLEATEINPFDSI